MTTEPMNSFRMCSITHNVASKTKIPKGATRDEIKEQVKREVLQYCEKQQYKGYKHPESIQGIYDYTDKMIDFKIVGIRA